MKRVGIAVFLFTPFVWLACNGDDSVSVTPGPDGSVADVVASDAPNIVLDSSAAADAAADAAVLTDNQIVGIVLAANTGEIDEAYLATGNRSGLTAGEGGVVTDAAAAPPFDAGAARSSNQLVTMFAEMMIGEHSSSNAAVRDFGIAAASSDVAATLQSTAQSTIVSLSGLTGAAFDTAYVAAQVSAHTIVRDLVRDRLIPGAQNPRLKSYLQNMLLPTVEAHLSAATALGRQLTDGGAASDGGTADAADAADASDGV